MKRKIALKTGHIVIAIFVLAVLLLFIPKGRHSLTDTECATLHPSSCTGSIRVYWVGSASPYSDCSRFTQDCAALGKTCSEGMCIGSSTPTVPEQTQSGMLESLMEWTGIKDRTLMLVVIGFASWFLLIMFLGTIRSMRGGGRY